MGSSREAGGQTCLAARVPRLKPAVWWAKNRELHHPVQHNKKSIIP